MNDHPRELLPLIAEGMQPPHDVRRHVAACAACSAALEALAPLDLAYAWEGIAAEADAPRPPLIERVLVACGVTASIARFVAVTPSLRPEWLLASAGILALAAAGMLLGGPNDLSLVVLVAPVVAAALVAFAYGPASDAAYELVAATPLSPLLAVLLRLAVVLAGNSVLVFAADVVASGSDGLRLAWFFPMTFVALLAAAIALRTSPLLGAGTGMALWTAAVFATVSLSDSPAAVLWGGPAQTVYALGSACLLTVLSLAIGRAGGFVPGGSVERRTV
jgi:hypothetical protein